MGGSPRLNSPGRYSPIVSKAKPPGEPKPAGERRRQPRRAADSGEEGSPGPDATAPDKASGTAGAAERAAAERRRQPRRAADTTPVVSPGAAPPAVPAAPETAATPPATPARRPRPGPRTDAEPAPEPPERRPEPTPLLNFLREPEWADEARLRFGVAVVLAAAGLFFFRTAAIGSLAGALLGAGLALGALNVGFHRIGIRPLGGYWPGFFRGMATALLVFCVCPPGLPLAMVAGLGALAVVIEGVERRLLLPIALTGVLLVWPLAWLLHGQAEPGFTRPFDLRPLDEPISLFNRFGEQFGDQIDPGRLYVGNVAGLLGATSFGLAAVCFVVLAYARKASWHYAAGFFGALALVLLVSRRPLALGLVSGPAAVFAGIIGAESRRLPRPLPWRIGGGALAGLAAGVLLTRQVGLEAYGFAVVGTAALISLFQFFGLAGSPGVVAGTHPERPGAEAAPQAPVRPVQVLLLAAVTPLGLVVLQRDQSLPRSQRRALLALGLALYAVAIGGSLLWLWALRYPV